MIDSCVLVLSIRHDSKEGLYTQRPGVVGELEKLIPIIVERVPAEVWVNLKI